MVKEEKNTNHPFETRRKSENVYTVEKSPAIMRDIAFGFIVRRSCFFFFSRNYIHVNGKASRNVYTLFSLLLLPLSSRSLHTFPSKSASTSSISYERMVMGWGGGEFTWKINYVMHFLWSEWEEREMLFVKYKFKCFSRLSQLKVANFSRSKLVK